MIAELAFVVTIFLVSITYVTKQILEIRNLQRKTLLATIQTRDLYEQAVLILQHYKANGKTMTEHQTQELFSVLTGEEDE